MSPPQSGSWPQLPPGQIEEHVLQVGASFDLGRGWRLAGRFLTYRGWPYIHSASNPYDEPTREHLSPFVRIDGRFEKRWAWRKAGYISLVLEILNATAAKEIVSRDCFSGVCQDQSIGPVIVPSLGVEGAL